MLSRCKSETTLRARLGAHTLHSQYDSKELTEAARAARWQQFLDQVDPDRVLPEDERIRRAEHAQLAHMNKMSLAAAKARRLAAAQSVGGGAE